MGLFDWLKKRKKNASTVSKGDPSLQAEVNVRPDEEIAEKLRHVGKIVDVDRCSDYMEMTLTVLFYNDQEDSDIPVGYFCVQQCSGAYYGAGFPAIFRKIFRWTFMGRSALSSKICRKFCAI